MNSWYSSLIAIQASRLTTSILWFQHLEESSKRLEVQNTRLRLRNPGLFPILPGQRFQQVIHILEFFTMLTACPPELGMYAYNPDIRKCTVAKSVE